MNMLPKGYKEFSKVKKIRYWVVNGILISVVVLICVFLRDIVDFETRNPSFTFALFGYVMAISGFMIGWYEANSWRTKKEYCQRNNINLSGYNLWRTKIKELKKQYPEKV